MKMDQFETTVIDEKTIKKGESWPNNAMLDTTIVQDSHFGKYKVKENLAVDINVRCKRYKPYPSDFTDKTKQLKATTYASSTCTICFKSFTSKRGLSMHMLIHNEWKPHTCSKCKRMFKQQTHLRSHKKYCGTNRKELKCTYYMLQTIF